MTEKKLVRKISNNSRIFWMFTTIVFDCNKNPTPIVNMRRKNISDPTNARRISSKLKPNIYIKVTQSNKLDSIWMSSTMIPFNRKKYFKDI
jgi:hypothetical protein